MQLVMLAAGYGTRFGGLKQLAPVGLNGEAIMDYTATGAKACGFDGVVVVIRKEIEDEIRAHIALHWPASLSVKFVYQPTTRGTAAAVLAARPCISGPFAVTNADDLYGQGALAMIPDHFASSGQPADPRHLLVGYRVANTIVGTDAVKRGLCERNADGDLQRIGEYNIVATGNGLFEATPLAQSKDDTRTPRVLDGSECVSMNLWGFHLRMFEHLERSVTHHLASDDPDGELLLPEVIEQLVATAKETIRVVVTESRCIGITHRDDLPIVREQIALLNAG